MSNVVQLKPRVARKKRRLRRKVEDAPTADARLIRVCIAYAQAEASYHAAFKVSLDVMYEYAGPAGQKMLKRAIERLVASERRK